MLHGTTPRLVKCIAFAISTICGSAYAVEQTAIIVGTDRRVTLRDDGTWAIAPEAPESGPVTPPKTPEDAVKVWDYSLDHRKVDYSNAIALSLHFENRTQKRIIGVVTQVTIKNAFGKTIFSQTLEDEVSLFPEFRERSENFWHWQDNPFIKGEIYDNLWPTVDSGNAKVSTRVIKVVFEDGTVLSAPAKKPTKTSKS